MGVDKEVLTKIIIDGDVRGYIEAMDKAQAATKKTETAAESMYVGTTKLSGGFSSLAGVAGMASGALGGLGLAQVVNQLHDAGMAAERLRNSFEAAAGGVQKGADAYTYARNEAKRLGLDLQSTADAFMGITAASKGTALEGEKTQQIFSSVAGASRSLGLSADQMHGALLAVQQMMNKGTVASEELRGQLGERLPGAFQIAARSMGVTTAELGKMLEGGKVISEDFLPKFAAELQNTFPPGEKAMSGLTAETMRLKTAFFELKTVTMESGGEGFMTFAIRQTRLLTEEVSALAKMLGKVADNPVSKAGVLGTIATGAAGGAYAGAAAGPVGMGTGAVLGAGMAATGLWGVGYGSGVLDQSRPKQPLTRSDKFLIGGGDYGFSARTDSLFTPQFSSRMRSPDEYTADFGSSLNRNPTYEAPKPADLKRAALAAAKAAREKKDAQALADVMGETSLYEAGAMYGSGNFAALAAFGLNGEKAVANRYRYTRPSLFGGPPGITGVESFVDDSASVKQYAASRAASAKSAEMGGTFAAMQASQAGSEKTAGMLMIDKEEQYWRDNWAMKTSSLEEYEARNMQITEYYAEKRKQVERAETSYKINLARSGFSSVASLADSFYTLSKGKNKAAFKIYQTAKSGETIISTADAAMKAYSAMAGIPLIGPGLGVAAAAAAIAAGAVQLQSIWSANPDGGGQVGNIASGGSSYTGPGTQPVTQPLPSTASPQAFNIVMQFDGTTLVDEQKLTRWTEDILIPSIRDLKTRGVTV